MKKIIILFCSLILFLSTMFVGFAFDEESITATILYDNYLFTEGLKTDWGFACFIEGTEKTILFDTGTKGDILLHNVDKLKVNLKGVDLVLLSHFHEDHTGGIWTFLKENSDVSVYMPASFPKDFAEKIQKKKAQVVTVKGPIEICQDVHLTGEMGKQIIEQSLILNTSKGLVLITGCAHPGIVDTIKRAKEILNKNVYLVFGGFHLLQHSASQLEEIIGQFKDLGVQKVGATHCTGDKAIEMFKEAYGDNFFQMGAGKALKISK